MIAELQGQNMRNCTYYFRCSDSLSVLQLHLTWFKDIQVHFGGFVGLLDIPNDCSSAAFLSLWITVSTSLFISSFSSCLFRLIWVPSSFFFLHFFSLPRFLWNQRYGHPCWSHPSSEIIYLIVAAHWHFQHSDTSNCTATASMVKASQQCIWCAMV